MTVQLDPESYAYPKELLEHCSSALVLFCSGRMGAADGYWIREAGLENVVCVDHDPKTLQAFKQEYPPEWVYVQADACEYIRECLANLEPLPDLISADPPSQYAPELFQHLPEWGLFTDRYLVATVFRHCFANQPATDELPRIEGMVATDLRHRSDFRGGVYWAVYQRV